MAVHYFRPGRPFKNLSDLALEDLIVAYKMLEGERARGEHRRVFGRRYMDLRRRSEAKLRDCFVAAGGEPERTAPHYFVLGASSWFKGLADDMQEIAIAIADLPTEATSITYGMPLDDPAGYDGYEHRLFEHYIEVQLWTDEPVERYLT
jgi:hypothetical protein